MSTARALTQSQLRDLEAELRSERARLERSVRAQEAAGRQEPDGETSVYDLSNGGGIGTGLQTSTTARLEAIIAALTRIADGSYGSCSSCRAPIPYGRLLVMPETTLCVACGRT